MTLKTPILRSERHRRFVARHICVVCMKGKLIETDEVRSQAAHVRALGPCGIGMKPSDEHVVPLCLTHHRGQHSQSEPNWWRLQGIDPARIAAALVELSPCKRINPGRAA